MSMSSPSVTETSLMISLADLTKVEEQRVREEDAAHERARIERVRQQRETEAQRRAREAAKVAAQAEARAKEERERALTRAQLEARERAAVEVARIEAEAKVRLEAENAMRAHELATLRVKTETRRRRRELALAGLLAVALLGSAAFASQSSTRVATAEHAVEEAREGQRAALRERDEAKRLELSSLDRRLGELAQRAGASGAQVARETAESARRAIDERALDHGRLRALADAVDALQIRIERVEKLDALGRRHKDLAAWAVSLRRADTTANVKNAAIRANAATAASDAIALYERALDELARTLAKPAGAGGRLRSQQPQSTGGTCRPDDPSCGLDGRPLF